MQLMPIDKRNGVRNDMAVQMVFVLVDAEQGLKAAKESPGKGSSDLKALSRRDPFIFVEADDVMGIHPPRVFSPLLLLVQEASVHTFPVYLIRSIRAGDIDISFRDLIAAEDISDDVLHCPVAF